MDKKNQMKGKEINHRDLTPYRKTEGIQDLHSPAS
jgi:hypothetical protein